MTTYGTRGCLCYGFKIGDGEPKGRISVDRVTQRGHRLGRVHGLLRLAIEGGGLHRGGDDPTVVLNRGPVGDWVAAPAGFLLILVHDCQVGHLA